MQLDQKVKNSMWVAHGINTTDLFPHTLRNSLVECKAAYIRQEIMSKDVVKKDLDLYLLTGLNLVQKVVDDYEHLIPSDVNFVIVTLNPRWETEVS